MTLAFPADELRPLTCDGRTKRERGDLDSMLGNYSMCLGPRGKAIGRLLGVKEPKLTGSCLGWQKPLF